MQWKTKAALVVASSLGMIAGARGEDAADASRGSLVLAAGDKVHGHLRGGETHVLQVHLAKGDVYSFSVAAKKSDEPLLLHLSFRDPTGREVNMDAGVKHLAHGSRVTLGPYRVPATGTYAIELSGDGPFEGDYAGASKVKSARATYRLPQDGTSVAVDVAAGATLRLLAKDGLARLVMALPGKSAQSIESTDPFVVALRAGGLASSQTGTYTFAAPGARDVSVDVRRPRWTPIDVAFPTLSSAAALAADAARVAAWQAMIAGAPKPTIPSADAAPSAVDPSVTGLRGATLFVGSSAGASAAYADHLLGMLAPLVLSDTNAGGASGSDPGDAGAAAPVDPGTIATTISSPYSVASPDGFTYYDAPSVGPVAATTAAGTPTRNAGGPTMPNTECTATIGTSMFSLPGVGGGWRCAPWATATNYPDAVRSRLLTLTTSLQPGSVSVTLHYFVEGHEVSALLATGGETTIQWTVHGAGTIGGAAWTIDGSWSMDMHESAPSAWAPALPDTCTLAGSERFVTGDLTETVSTTGLTSTMNGIFWDPVGSIKNTLTVGGLRLSQTNVRDMQPSVPPDGEAETRGEPTKIIRVTTTTIDPSTPAGGVIDDEEWESIVC